MQAATVVREARHASGLTQRALAERAGVPQSTVARVEAATLDPRADTLDRLMRAAGFELVAQRRPGEGVDRSQIRERLRLTPRQRIDEAVAAHRNVQRLRRKRT